MRPAPLRSTAACEKYQPAAPVPVLMRVHAPGPVLTAVSAVCAALAPASPASKAIRTRSRSALDRSVFMRMSPGTATDLTSMLPVTRVEIARCVHGRRARPIPAVRLVSRLRHGIPFAVARLEGFALDADLRAPRRSGAACLVFRDADRTAPAPPGRRARGAGSRRAQPAPRLDPVRAPDLRRPRPHQAASRLVHPRRGDVAAIDGPEGPSELRRVSGR